MSAATGIPHFLFVGNPGTGKSTLINMVAGEPLCQSRPSWNGSGVTCTRDEKYLPGKGIFMDTPGLADDTMKQRAAEEITAALKKDGFYRVFFVVTHLNGRVNAMDKTTMRLILQAAPTITDYGIIVNQVEPGWLDNMGANPENMRRWIATLMDGLPRVTTSIQFVSRIPELVNQENAKYAAPQEVVDFILCCPGMKILSQDVQSVEVDEFAALRDELENRILVLQRNKAKMETELRKLAVEMQAAEQRAQAAREDATKARRDASEQVQQRAVIEDELNRANRGQLLIGVMTLGVSRILRWW